MKKLIEFTESLNIADDIDENKLASIAGRVIQQFNEDNDSMSDWKKLNDKGLELATPDITPKSTPWQGAANYKHTGIQSACISFGDRASAELLKDADLMLTDFIGKDDDKGSKRATSDRIGEYENYHINYLMEEFRDNQSKLMYELSAYGTLFKKVWYDPMEGKKVSSIIHYPNFAVSQGTSTLDSSRSFTEIHSYSLNEAKEFQNMGLWSDVDISQNSEDNQEGSNASEDSHSNSENMMCYYEQNTYLDLDDDGYEEPYIVTVHVPTSTVMRIVADYTLDDIVVDNAGSMTNLGVVSRIGEMAMTEVCKSGYLIKINRSMDIVKYGFIRSVDGKFLDIGYFWLLGAMTQLVNTTANQLIDAGTLNNRKGGFLSKEFRKGDSMSGGTTFKAGEWKQTDIPAALLAGGVMPLPQGEPSQTLLTMNQDAKNEISKFASSIDLQGIISGNTPATTALVAVQEQIVPISAIYQYIQRSMSKEFEILKRLTPLHCTEDSYKEVVGDEFTIEKDYSSGTIIKATAQKQMSNKVVRMYEAEGMMNQLPAIQSAGGNPLKVIRNYFEQFQTLDIDDVMPEMSEEEEAAQLEKMNIQSQKETQLLDLQIAKENSAVEAFKAEQQAFNMKERGNLAALEEKILNMQSETALNYGKLKEQLASAVQAMATAEEKYAAIENGKIETAMGMAEKVSKMGGEVEIISIDGQEGNSET